MEWIEDAFVIQASCINIAPEADRIDAYCYTPTRSPCHKLLSFNERIAYTYNHMRKYNISWFLSRSLQTKTVLLLIS